MASYDKYIAGDLQDYTLSQEEIDSKLEQVSDFAK